MPGFDRTGPRGRGRGTGRGLGPCYWSDNLCNKMICPYCGACACDYHFVDGHCPICGGTSRVPYTPEVLSTALKKEAKSLKRLITALELDHLIPEVDEAQKYAASLYEALSDLDFQSDLDALNSTLWGIDYHKGDIGDQLSKTNNLIKETIDSLLQLNKQLKQEIKDLKSKQRAQESGEPEDSGELQETEEAPIEEAIDEEAQENIIDEIMKEDEEESKE